MKLSDLAERIGASHLAPGGPSDTEIDRVCAGDNISHLLNQASENTLVVTHLTGHSLVRAVSLVDAPAICLLNGATPEADVVQAAQSHGTALIVSPVGMFETCGRLYQCLHCSSQAGT